jgi:hypothetical protein
MHGLLKEVILMKKSRIVFSILSTLLIILACNVPSAAPETETPDFPATLTAIAVEDEIVQPPLVDQSTETAPETFTPILPTPLPTAPMVSVSVDTNCRTGPGQSYDYLTALRVGEQAEVVGKYTSSTPPYWIIRRGSITCWLWGQYATIAGDVSSVPEMIPPPSPTPLPTNTLPPTSTPSATPTTPPPSAAGDLVLLEFFQATTSEIVLRVGNQPAGSLSGNFQYQVYANGALVRTGTCPIPSGSAACWTGYIVSGVQTIRAVIDSNNAIPETNESNNEITLNCNSTTKFCN